MQWDGTVRDEAASQRSEVSGGAQVCLCNVQSRNILLSRGGGTAKIADVGMASVIQTAVTSQVRTCCSYHDRASWGGHNSTRHECAEEVCEG